jgi:hypothetical protein
LKPSNSLQYPNFLSNTKGSLLYNQKTPIPVAVLYTAHVYSRLNAGTGGSNTAEGMDIRLLCLLLFCVGSGLYDELITRTEVCVFLIVCDLEIPKQKRPRSGLGCCSTEEEEEKEERRRRRSSSSSSRNIT